MPDARRIKRLEKVILHTIAPEISDMALRVASAGESPSAMCRWVFSTTMMASSTTIPMAKIRPNSVIMLME